MLRAAAILRRAGVADERIQRTLRELGQVFAERAGERSSAAASSPESAPRSTRGAKVRVRTQLTVTEYRGRPTARGMDEAGAHFERGLALEESDVEAARQAYVEALARHSDHLEARINLGRLMHLNGELQAAEEIYRAAGQGSALLAFNLALVLEDLGRDQDAIVAYRESLAHDPTMHEAHLNLSLLYERTQSPREALRHMLAYRRSGAETESKP
jgi:tetratricopeptide (TPR) repeat protein